MTNYVSKADSLYEITNRYPETTDLFISIGFENMSDEKTTRNCREDDNFRNSPKK